MRVPAALEEKTIMISESVPERSQVMCPNLDVRRSATRDRGDSAGKEEDEESSQGEQVHLRKQSCAVSKADVTSTTKTDEAADAEKFAV